MYVYVFVYSSTMMHKVNKNVVTRYIGTVIKYRSRVESRPVNIMAKSPNYAESQ